MKCLLLCLLPIIIVQIWPWQDGERAQMHPKELFVQLKHSHTFDTDQQDHSAEQEIEADEGELKF